MLSWTLLATVYCVPVRVFSFLENRDLEWGQSWLLAGAAMMPGADSLPCRGQYMLMRTPEKLFMFSSACQVPSATQDSGSSATVTASPVA